MADMQERLAELGAQMAQEEQMQLLQIRLNIKSYFLICACVFK